ncbi:zinc ribbon domain-containing protein [Nonomuraea ferruginea]
MPETLPFWEGAADKELRVQRCTPCSRHYFYPPARSVPGAARRRWSGRRSAATRGWCRTSSTTGRSRPSTPRRRSSWRWWSWPRGRA